MKSMKKCGVTENKISIKEKLDKLRHKRCSSAGMFYTSSAGAVTSLILMIALCGIMNLINNINNVNAATSVLSISITNSIGLSVIPTNSSGTFASSDTTTPNISVATNHATGYTLGIAASTEGSNALVNIADSTKTIPSHTISAGVSGTDYADSTYASTNNLNNTWGYRPSKYYDTTNNVAIDNTSTNLYFPGPSSASTPTILDQTDSPNSTDSTTSELIPNEYNIAIGTRITNTTTAGDYFATYVITAIVNPITYSITYHDNSSSAGSGFPTNVSNQTTRDSQVVLSSTTPTRTGYDFAGWCTNNTADNGTCNGTSYQAGGSWSLDQTINPNTLNLYAMWNIKKYTLTINFAGSGVSSVQVRTASGTGGTLMGTVSSSGGSVSNLVYNTAYYLYPAFSSGYQFSAWAKTSGQGTLSSTSASNPTFTIGLGNGTVTVTGKASCQSTISGNMQTFNPCSSIANGTSGTLTDSRDNNSYTVKKINGQFWMTQNLRFSGTSLNTSTSNVTSNKTLTWYDLEGTQGSSTSGKCYGTFTMDSNYNITGVSGAGLTSTCKHNSTNTSYGVYYNYSGATAGTITGTSNTTAASQDICPKNWRLPTNSEYSGITSSVSAFSPVYSGYYDNGSLINTGTAGYWWSSTARTAYSRYGLSYSSGSLSTVSGFFRYYGFSVRCVRK